MTQWGINLIQFTNMNPFFKGTAVALLGAFALLFSFWMRKHWKEPLTGGFLLFISLSVFIVLYGLFILIFQPQWWKLPY